MERAPRSKGTIVLKYLQKAATFTITNNPHSPRGSAADRLPATRGASGPIASIIPTEARLQKRHDDAFNEEPTSPKVTCIGQIKHRKTTATDRERKKKTKKNNKSIPSVLTRMLSQRVRPEHEKKKEKKKKKQEMAPAPALGQLKRFSSRRESLADFDWQSSDNEEGKEDRMTRIYHSAPLVLGGDAAAAETRETGLWRRRSIAALMPLQVNK